MAKLLARLLTPYKIMVKQCAWCRRIIGFKRHGYGVTSTICAKCIKREGW